VTTVTTGIPLKAARLDIAPDVEAAAWATKSEALTALGDLRTRGFNHVEVEAHTVRRPLSTGWWVLARPDHFEGVTYLMTAAGGWLRGRLVDVAPCYADHACSWDAHPVPWQPLGVEVFPAPFTHVTRVVRDAAGRPDRYRTKANGSCGRWVPADDVVAVCACGWKRWADSRAEARGRARYHRANPDAEPKLPEVAA
jgi:hypothetical protein